MSATTKAVEILTKDGFEVVIREFDSKPPEVIDYA